MMQDRKQAGWLDLMGIGISGACLAHCLLLPLIVAFAPAWSHLLDLPANVHGWILALALPFSGSVLWSDARRSLSARRSLAIGLAGLGLMTVGIFATPELLEIVLTSCGGIMVATAHLRNWRCRRSGHRE